MAEKKDMSEGLAMETYIQSELRKSRDAVDALIADRAVIAELMAVSEKAVAVLRGGKKIMLAGNGGSASDAQHIAAEIVGRLMHDRPSLPALSLATDTSVLTAVGNDYGYEKIFQRQIEGLGQEGDMFIGISTSGNSANILAALDAAKAKGIIAVGLTGKTGGKMRGVCDHMLCVPSTETPRIQECHIMIGHIVCGIIESTLFPGAA